jgi:hypothetical protein
MEAVEQPVYCNRHCFSFIGKQSAPLQKNLKLQDETLLKLTRKNLII